MSLFAELRRRNVFRVAIFYIVSAWLLLQIADLIFEVLLVPDWTLRFVFGVLVAALPFVLFFAWAYELTPEGIKREADVDRTISVTPQTGRKMDRLIIAVLALAVVVLLVDRWRGSEVGSAQTGSELVSRSSESNSDHVSEPVSGTNTRSIAVLPFQDFSGGEDQAWFAAGLSEEILNALARIPDLLVASRSAAFAFAAAERPIREVAEALKVAYVLEGSVRRAPERIRVTAQLIRASDGFHVWSENYDRELEDVIAIQEDIALAIARALETAMDPAALAEMLSAGTRSVAAYDAYLRALALGQQSRAEGSFDLRASLREADRAVEIDPAFARAQGYRAEEYRSLASSSVMSTGESGGTSDEYHQRFEEAIRAAITNAPTEIERWSYQAFEARAGQRLALAADRYEAVLAERPNDAETRTSLATVRIMQGDHDAAVAVLRPIMEDALPVSWFTMNTTGNQLVWAGRPEEAISVYDKALVADPGNASVLYHKHRALLWAGRYDEAQTVYAALKRNPPTERYLSSVEIRNACVMGDRDAAEAILATKEPDDYNGRWHGEMLLGRRDRAEAVLAPLQETEAGLGDLAGYLIYPQFDPAPYPRLMARIAEELVSERPFVDALPFACPPEEVPSIAVLPFVNMSGDADNQYFSDGIAEELLNALVKIDGLRVPSRTSSFRFRDADQGIAEIAEALGVAHVLEGSVRKAGNQVRITAQLIEAKTDQHLWSETYTRTLDDIFAIQDEISRAIVEQLELQLGTGARPELAGTRNSEAYDHYLKGRYHWHQRTAADLALAGRELRDAVTLDPAFADAWAALADVYTLHPEYGVAEYDASIPAAREALARALELDPDSAMALTTRAYLAFRYDRAFAVAEADFKAALRLDPDYATAHQWYAEMLMALGRLDEALASALRAYELDPVGPIKPTVLGNAYWSTGRVDEAIDHYRQALELSSDNPYPLRNLSGVLTAVGRFDEAREVTLRYDEAVRSPGAMDYARAAIDALEGRLPKEQARSRILAAIGDGDCRVNGPASYLPLVDGDEEALDVFERCMDDEEPFVVMLRWAPAFKTLHGNPRFEALVARLGLPGTRP